jgi:hypothetical protein
MAIAAAYRPASLIQGVRLLRLSKSARLRWRRSPRAGGGISVAASARVQACPCRRRHLAARSQARRRGNPAAARIRSPLRGHIDDYPPRQRSGSAGGLPDRQVQLQPSARMRDTTTPAQSSSSPTTFSKARATLTRSHCGTSNPIALDGQAITLAPGCNRNYAADAINGAQDPSPLLPVKLPEVGGA